MAVKIVEIQKESWPHVRLIGKKYDGAPNWGEWWANDWFSKLECSPRHPLNQDAFVGAVRVKDGKPERWIGMFFPVETMAPEGFDYIDLPALDYAVCYIQAPDGSQDFYTHETHQLCLDALKAQGLTRKEDDWCFERYQCPRFTTPDSQGNVILDYGISIL